MTLSQRGNSEVDRGWAWGIDCGSLRAGIGLVHLDTGEMHAEAYAWRTESMELAESLTLCHFELDYSFRTLAVTHPPATIAFEFPTGRNRNPSLMMHTGVIVLAATQATSLHPWRCGVTEWKKVVQGHGQAPKASLIPWAASLGYATGDVDQAAGLAIAAYAAVTVGGLDLGLLHGTVEAAA